MTLLKFIELQRKDTFLNKVPISLKFGLIIYSLVSIFLPINKTLINLSLIILLISLTIIFLIAYRDIGYIAEIYLSYLLLFIFAYFSVLFGNIELDYLLTRLIYIYSTAFTFLFFVTTTKVKDLEGFLTNLKIPEKIISALILTWNFIPSTYNELQLIQICQKARGVELEKGLLNKFKNSFIILIPFLFLLLLRMQLIEFSLKSRGVE